MDRRTFIAGIGLTGVSGCTGLVQSSSNLPTTTPSDSGKPASPTETSATRSESTPETEEVPEPASIVDLQTANRTYALTPTRYRTPDEGIIQTHFTATATAEHPATLSASLENGNDFANTFRIEWTPPFGRLTSRIPRPFAGETTRTDATYRVGLVLAPTANHDLVDEPPELERSSDGYWRLVDSVDQWLPERVRLAPGETIHGEYALVGRPGGKGKGRPTGVYEFRGSDDADLRLAVWDTNSPGPDQDSEFAGAYLPALSEEKSTAWYHEAEPTTAAYLQPSQEEGELPIQITFTFMNKSRTVTECGHWNLYKLASNQWFHIGPYAHTADCRLLAPGQTKSWTLNAYPGEALPRIEPGRSGANYGHLGAGQYAVIVGYGEQTEQSAALVGLQGEEVSIVPTTDVTTTRSGATLTATSQRYKNDDRQQPATLTLTRADSTERVLIPEQVMRRRYRGLRNTLAFLADDVETVVLQTDERVAQQVVGYDKNTQRFQLHGRGAFEIAMEMRDEEPGSTNSTHTASR